MKNNLSQSFKSINAQNKKIIKNNSDIGKIFQKKIIKISKINNNNPSSIEQNNNRSKMMMIFKYEEINSSQISKVFKVFSKQKIKKTKDISSYNSEDLKSNNNELISNINFNIFDYICCIGKIRKKNANIEVFDFGVKFYRNQLNIINVFNLIFLSNIILYKHPHIKVNSFLNQKFEIPVREL